MGSPYKWPSVRNPGRRIPNQLMNSDDRAEIALNILGFLIGLYYAAIIKAGCPPACEFRFPKSGLRVPGFGKMRTPEFRRIGNSPEPRDPPATARHERAGGGQAPGVLHHVMGRGIEIRKIFIDKRDRQDFITRMTALAFEKLCTFCTSVS